jgi:hypothetical protein
MDVIELGQLSRHRLMDLIPKLDNAYFNGCTLPGDGSLLGTEFGFDGCTSAGTHRHSVEIWILHLKNLNNFVNVSIFE